MGLADAIIATFQQHFNDDPAYVVRSPGRVNLIGGSTDYNEGFVLPVAIDRAIWAAFTPRSDDVVRLYSYNFESQVNFSLNFLTQTKGWHEYIKGVAWALQELGFDLLGFDAVIGGNVPRGAGLSSSAALEMAAARAFAVTSGLTWDPVLMAKASQRAENEWVGLHCGIMDQFIAGLGEQGHALLLDCRTLETELVPLPEDLTVVILDTGTRRSLPASAYNARREECEAAAQALEVPHLRDADLALLKDSDLPTNLYKRARHVITENARVLHAAKAMRRGDAAALGRLVNDSHASLRDDFEVGSEALDAMARCAMRHKACYGARLTGAGYAGCCVALVEDAQTDAFAADVEACYRQETKLDPAIYVCTASDGVSLVNK